MSNPVVNSSIKGFMKVGGHQVKASSITSYKIVSDFGFGDYEHVDVQVGESHYIGEIDDFEYRLRVALGM